LIPLARRFLFGSAKTHSPKALYYPTATPTTSEYYEGMNKYYRWFRQDELVRKCIVTNAYFACMSAGYETVLEAAGEGVDVEDYGFVKERVDEFNKRVNMDLMLFVAQVKRSIYGKARFEVVLGEDEFPKKLIPLQSDKLKPNINEVWEVTGYRYQGRDGFYSPEEVLYFVNLPLD